MRPRTLYEKIWDKHVVYEEPGKPSLLYIDLHLLIETSSPQAFNSLRLAGRSVRRPDLTVATIDHSIPTINRDQPIADPLAREQIKLHIKNCNDHGIKIFDIESNRQGIVHVIAPELGLTLPGQTIVCGDSHTSTHGAFGALAFGIGTSEVEHVLATQCLPQYKSKTLEIVVNNRLPNGVTAKDLILFIIGKLGTDFANGHVVEYRGEAIKELSMEERMTICNMSIEMGARAGLIAPDEKTFEYIKQCPYAPKGKLFEEALKEWSHLYSDKDAIFDQSVSFDAATITPQVTWGTNPSMVIGINEKIPNPKDFSTQEGRYLAERALDYMGLAPGERMTEIPVDVVFIGSCTNSRIEDLRLAAKVIRGKRKADHVRAIVVPGSMEVRRQAEKEGLDRIFVEAGFEWREPGCSMCIGMNGDEVGPGERCASTSNRNFEGRQGERCTDTFG